jgi:hypothetical protein
MDYHLDETDFLTEEEIAFREQSKEDLETHNNMTK